jgi:transposase
MSKAHSEDLRIRVVEFVESGGSLREAESTFVVGASSAFRWRQRFQETGSVACAARGGSVSPLDKKADVVLGLIKDHPDMTLEELRAALAAKGIVTSISSVWRFCERHKISFKKNGTRRRAGSARRGRSARRVEERAASA